MIRLPLLAGAAAFAIAATPVVAQSMPGMGMPNGQAGSNAMDHPIPGMAMPTGSEPGQGMAGMPAREMNQPATGTNLPAGNAPPPPLPTNFYADRAYSNAAMDRARAREMRKEGGQLFYQVLFNLAEYQVRNGRDGYRWDGEAWLGWDINRLVLKSEGEGTLRRGVDSAELQALYNHAIGPYFNLQAGLRHDFAPSPTRTYATIGVEGLAPYMSEVEAALFLSTKGELLARAEGWYDEHITQRLILQPRVELNFAAQDIPEDRIGAGLTDAELGLRLRYEILREFAPYVGVSYQAQAGRTATFARRAGEDTRSTALVLGIRTWF